MRRSALEKLVEKYGYCVVLAELADMAFVESVARYNADEAGGLILNQTGTAIKDAERLISALHSLLNCRAD